MIHWRCDLNPLLNQLTIKSLPYWSAKGLLLLQKVVWFWSFFWKCLYTFNSITPELIFACLARQWIFHFLLKKWVGEDKRGRYRLINIFHFLYFQWKFWSLPSHIRKLRYLWLFHCWACHRWWWQMIKFYKHKHNNTLAVILTLFVLFSFLRNKFSNEPLQTFSVHWGILI